MNTEMIKKELKHVFGNDLDTYLGKQLELCTEEELNKKFEEYAKQNLTKIKIKDLIDNYQDESFLLNTPDGLNEVGDFYVKGERDIYKIVTVDGFFTKCSNDHLFQTSEGWKKAQEITKKDQLYTKRGYKKVKDIIRYKKKEPVYDFEVLHENHRYWSGNGISSHNSGKTYLALSVCRNAQKMGYDIIYFDSEGAIDKDFVSRLGVDTSRIRLQPVNTIEQVNHILSQLTKNYEEMISKDEVPPKIMIVLDSLGNLSSDKEAGDSESGSDKRDMTKQQSIRKLFRVNGMRLAKFGIPFIVTTHTYDAIGSYFPAEEMSGGGGLKFNASIIFMLTKKKLLDNDAEKKAKEKNVDAVRVGVTVAVKPIKQRFAKPIKVEMHIPFYKKPNPYVGLEKFVSWEDCGILRGKCLNEKAYKKLSDKEKESCFEFQTKEGETLWAFPKDTARTLVCRHLEGEVPINELFTAKVFTEEVLRELDEKVIKPTFMLPNIDSLDDLAEITENLEEDITDEELEEIN